MDEGTRAGIDFFFHDQTLQGSLSSLGLFALDFVHQRAFRSSIWAACGYDQDDMLEDALPSLLHPDDRDRVTASLEAVRDGRQDRYEDVFRLRKADGTWAWIVTNCAVIYRDGRGVPLLYLGHDQDVTAIKRAEEEARRRFEEIETLRQVIADVNSSLDLAETVTLILEHTRRVIPYQKATVQLLEETELRVIGCIGFSDREAALQLRFPFPQGRSPSTRAVQSRMPVVCNDLPADFPDFRHMAGEERVLSWLGIPLIAGGQVIGLLALDSLVPDFYDARHLEMAETFAGHVALAVEKARLFEDVRTKALTDHLTGAGNRHCLQLQGPFFYEKAKRESRRICALMVDLDRFKRVNDTWGHEVGDAMLRESSALIQRCLRGYDLFFRYGGEEFLVLLPDTSARDAAEVAERIRLVLEATPRAGVDPSPTASIGLGSVVPPGSSSLSDLIRMADQALYEAKNAGRNRVVVREL